MSVAIHQAAERAAAGPEPATYRRRRGALFMTLYSLVVSCVFVAFPVAFVGIFFLLGNGGVPLWANIWVIVVGGILVVPGITGLLHGFDRVRLSTGDPVLLQVGPGGLWLRDAGLLSWPQIVGVRAGDVDIVRSKYDFGGTNQRLEVVPRDAVHLGGRPWFAVTEQRIRGAIRRRKPFGDRTPLRHGLQLDLDLLDTPAREVFAEIARYRSVDGLSGTQA